jgi:type IV secretory pathway VirJ component
VNPLRLAVLVASLASAVAAAPCAAAAPARGAEAPAAAPDVRDLPLVEVPAAGDGKRFAVMLTGDGGWVGLDRDVARTLAQAGVSVVGLDSLRYFWRHRTPDETARDVARIIQHYRSAWGRPEAILIGYSRGADIVPFLPARLPADARASLVLVAMLAPGTYAEFEVHVVDLFSSRRRSDATSTEKAVRADGGAVPMLCVQGADERDNSLCPRLVDLAWVKRVVLPGAHHFDHDYAKVGRLILEAAPPGR